MEHLCVCRYCGNLVCLVRTKDRSYIYYCEQCDIYFDEQTELEYSDEYTEDDMEQRD